MNMMVLSRRKNARLPCCLKNFIFEYCVWILCIHVLWLVYRKVPEGIRWHIIWMRNAGLSGREISRRPGV